MDLKVRLNHYPSEDELTKTFVITKLAGLTAQQVDTIYKFVGSEENEIALISDGYAISEFLIENPYKVINVLKASSDGGPFVVALKAYRHRKAKHDRQLSTIVDVPVGVFFRKLYRAIGW